MWSSGESAWWWCSVRRAVERGFLLGRRRALPLAARLWECRKHEEFGGGNGCTETADESVQAGQEAESFAHDTAQRGFLPTVLAAGSVPSGVSALRLLW